MKTIVTLLSVVALSSSAVAQTFTWTTNDSVVENLAQNTTVQFPLHQQAVGSDTITLGIEVIHNDLPATWDGMLCIYGSCLGSIPPVGTTAQMSPIHGTIEGMVRLTVNPMNGTQAAKLQVYVYDVAFPNDGDTATFLLNTTLNTPELTASNGANVYPNPVTSVLTIASEGFETFMLYSADGSLVKQVTLNGTIDELDVKALPAGVYHGQFTSVTGEVFSTKIVKE